MTLQDITDKITSKIIMFIVGMAMTASTGFLTHSYNEQDKSNEKLIVAVANVVAGMDAIQKSMFDDKITSLKKQSYKISLDASQVRPMDITSSVNFCASSLYDKYMPEANGTEKIVVEGACADVNNWASVH